MTGNIARIVKANVTCDEDGCTRKVEAYTVEGSTTEARARARLQGWTRGGTGRPVKDFCPKHGL